MADAITDTYTAFLVRDLTWDNLPAKEIHFTVSGDKNLSLKLKDGKLIMDGKEASGEIDVRDVSKVQIAPGVVRLMYIEGGKQKIWAKLNLYSLLNIRALYFIVESFSEQKS